MFKKDSTFSATTRIVGRSLGSLFQQLILTLITRIALINPHVMSSCCIGTCLIESSDGRVPFITLINNAIAAILLPNSS